MSHSFHKAAKASGGSEYLLDLNKKHSLLFAEPGAALERRRYRAAHPTEIAFIKCMDGRVHGPVMTETPLGIIQPWRNLGGKFDLGWFGFAQSMRDWVDYSVRHGRNCLVFVTYHYSRGDVHRGCRGFNYDVEAARASMAELKKQFDRVFGKKVVYAILVGVETDWESLVLHGEDGKTVDLVELADQSEHAIEKLIRTLYPDMPERIQLDLLPLIQGNIRHAGRTKHSDRSVTVSEHQEWVLGVGRGFDWLHETNTALIVGPFDPHLSQAIATAATLIKGNIDEKRIVVGPGKGIVLLSSAPYRDAAGPERLLAEEKAKFLNRFSMDIIRSSVPELMEHVEQLTVTVDLHTRKIDVI